MTGAVVIEGDDFYAGGSNTAWDARSPQDKVANAMDWRRQRALLAELRLGAGASWFPFDWTSFDDATLAAEALHCGPADVIILEGAYCARPELGELIDFRVLLDTPQHICMTQLRAREGDDYSEDWESRWREAEDYYFGKIMPRSAFDLVIDGS